MQRVPFLIVDEWTDAMRRFTRAIGGAIAEMRAFAKDEMQVRRIAIVPGTALLPAFVAVEGHSEVVPYVWRTTYFADGADLEYG